jgi:cell division protein ZapA
LNNKVTVTICGKAYHLQTTEPESYVKEISKQLQRKIEDLMNSSENMTLTSAAILVALSLIDESTRTSSDIDNIRTQIKGYIEETAQSRIEADEAKRQLEEYKSEVHRLKTDIELLTLKDTI